MNGGATGRVRMVIWQRGLMRIREGGNVPGQVLDSNFCETQELHTIPVYVYRTGRLPATPCVR